MSNAAPKVSNKKRFCQGSKRSSSNGQVGEHKETKNWILSAIGWLYDTFPIGGVNLEFAEGDVCYTPDCVAARQAQGHGGQYGRAVAFKNKPEKNRDFYKDLARIMSFVIPEIHARMPQTWIAYATYGEFTAEMQSDPPQYIRTNPSYAIAQWELNDMLTDLVPRPDWRTHGMWPEGFRPPGKEYIGYVQWNAYYTGNQKGFFVDQYREAARRAYRQGFKGLDAYGEESADFPNVELSYLAFSEFSYNPEMTDEDFLSAGLHRFMEVKKRAASSLTSHAASALFAKAPRPKTSPHIDLAYRGRRLSADYGKPRWDRLIHHIQNVLPE